MTSAQKIIDQELAQFGWVESIATNSISDFKSPKESVVELRNDVKTSNLIDTFICHSIFYVIFCYSLCLYVFIDLGFGFFLKNKVNRWLKVQKKLKYLPYQFSFPLIQTKFILNQLFGYSLQSH